MTTRRWLTVTIVSAVFFLAPIAIERITDFMLRARANSAAAAGAGEEEMAAFIASATRVAFVSYSVSLVALIALVVCIVGYRRSAQADATSQAGGTTAAA
jgi:multisubunit Na+/H+ antiporter MnhG subunit